GRAPGAVPSARDAAFQGVSAVSVARVRGLRGAHGDARIASQRRAGDPGDGLAARGDRSRERLRGDAVSAATSIVRFPPIVWTHPLLASLDARSRTELESAGELRALADGDALFAAGDSADAIFVVVRGEIALR